MDPGRRTWLACLAMGVLLPAALMGGAVAQESSPRVIDVRIENREVVAPQEAIRITTKKERYAALDVVDKDVLTQIVDAYRDEPAELSTLAQVEDR